jgi:hypothetical protein
MKLEVDAPDPERYADAGKFSLKALFKTRGIATIPKDLPAMKATLATANVALAAKYGNALACSILNYEHSSKKWGGSVGSATSLCELRSVPVPAGATTWEPIAKALAEGYELPLGAEFGDINVGVAYKDSSVAELLKTCATFGIAAPGGGATPWFELVKGIVRLDAGLKAKHAGDDNWAEEVKADKNRLKSMVWELKVIAVCTQLAELVKDRGSECPPLVHTIAMEASDLVELANRASPLKAGDAIQMYTDMELKVLQVRCKERGVLSTPEETEANALALAQIGQGMANPCILCERRLAAGAGSGKCWPWCQDTSGQGEDAMKRSKQKAVRGLVHLEETIKETFGKTEWKKLQAPFEGMGGRELAMEAAKCRPKFDSSGLDGSQLLERLVFESNLMKFMKIKVMAKRRVMLYDEEMKKSRKIAADLERGQDDVKMWHIFTRWEGKQDDKEKGVDFDSVIPAVPSGLGVPEAVDSLVKSVNSGGRVPLNRPSGKSHVHSPQNFQGHACTGPCCDMHFVSGKFDPSKCTTRSKRKTKLQFAGDLITSELSKQGFAVPFEALKAHSSGKAGYLNFQAGQTIFVWNETGDANAVLGKVGPDGGLWMSGWIGHGSEKPIYAEDKGFGEGVTGYAVGIFPGTAVTKPVNAEKDDGVDRRPPAPVVGGEPEPTVHQQSAAVAVDKYAAMKRLGLVKLCKTRGLFDLLSPGKKKDEVEMRELLKRTDAEHGEDYVRPTAPSSSSSGGGVGGGGDEDADPTAAAIYGSEEC